MTTARNLLLFLLLASPAFAQSTVLLWAPSPNATGTGQMHITAYSSAPRVDFFAGTTRIGVALPLPVVGVVPRAVAFTMLGANQFGVDWTPTSVQTVTIWAYACATVTACTGKNRLSGTFVSQVHVAPAVGPPSASASAKNLKRQRGQKDTPAPIVGQQVP